MKRSKIFIVIVLIISLFSSPSLGASKWKNFYRDLSKRLSKNRADYPNLTDSEFANFREVKVTGIGEGKLYRSSSPVKAWGNRNEIANRLSEAAKIKTFINTADVEKIIVNHKNFSQTYYSTQKFIGLDTGLKFQSQKFRNAVSRGIKFMAENEPPYLIHCDLGKDRAGIFCAIVECLTGASEKEIEADYMISFYNYFGIKPESDEYEFVADSEIRRFLPLIFGSKNINSETAEKFLLDIGVTEKEISTLKKKLL